MKELEQTKLITLSEIESMRKKLLQKSLSEGRAGKVYALLEGFEQTIIAQLFFEVYQTGKDVIQVMLLFYTAVEYLSKKNPLDLSLGELNNFAAENFQDLKSLMSENTLSKNMGQRALPILLLLAEVESGKRFNAIELGASTGLIGRALINSKRFIEQVDELVEISEQFSTYTSAVFDESGVPEFDSYLGIDIKLSDLVWNYYCIREPDLRSQYERFLQEFPDKTSGQTLIERSALGFSQMEEVANLENPVVITSMMLYQLPPEIRLQLQNEIISFLLTNLGYWVDLYYSEENNRFEGRIVRVNNNEVLELKNVNFLKGEGIEFEIHAASG